MRLVRIIDSESVRQLCIKNGFYTRGDCRAYDYLLNNLCSDSGYPREVSDSDIEKIARDIVDHSNRSAFEGIVKNALFVVCVRTVASMLANECCITEVAYDDKVNVKFYGIVMSLPFLRFTKILELDVRYAGTDFDYSSYDIYEDRVTGCLYATEIE